MRLLLLAGLCCAAIAPVAAADISYDKQTVTAAQQALGRLGYDVGPVDGKWTKADGEAMNDLRAKNGLSGADHFTGSSLALIHRLSPGDTTLPHPGILVTDPTVRRDYISHQYSDPATALCQGPVGPDGETLEALLQQEPIAKVTPAATPKGYITRGDDWYTPIMHAVMASDNACIAGDQKSCDNTVSLMSKWAEADALRPGVKRADNQKFEQIAWTANSVLRNFIFAYANARKLTSVDPQTDAAILDWLKARTDDYHWLHKSGNDPHSPDYWEAGNHAQADMMTAMAFGALVGDRSMMEPAFANWRESLRVMRDDGSLPNETKRGARALHYTTFQLSQLLATAEVAREQGLDPAGAEAAAGQTLQKALRYLLDAYEDFGKAIPYAKENEGPGPSNDYRHFYINPMHLGWIPAYVDRYGKDENIARMRSLVIDPEACSPASLKAEKVPEKACASGSLTIPKLLSIWETSDMPYMGYSAFCLQGKSSSDWMLP